jgi:bacterioferritin-associated ferredoxin
VNPDDEVCLCFHVSLRKVRGYLQREGPPVASLISDCLGAGTGCQWCVPFLKHLHKQHQSGVEPDLNVSPEEYMRSRVTYRATKARPIGPEGEAGAGGDVADAGGDAAGEVGGDAGGSDPAGS